MNEPTARTARGNRIGLGLTGIVLLPAAGICWPDRWAPSARSRPRDPVYAGRHRRLGARSSGRGCGSRSPRSAVVVGILALRWLLVQLRSDSLGRVVVDSDRTSEPGSGRADLPAQAVAGAVGREIDTYPGVSRVHAGLTGRPDEPELRLRITVDPDADLARVRRRITGEAIDERPDGAGHRAAAHPAAVDRRPPGPPPPHRDLISVNGSPHARSTIRRGPTNPR